MVSLCEFLPPVEHPIAPVGCAADELDDRPLLEVLGNVVLMLEGLEGLAQSPTNEVMKILLETVGFQIPFV